MTKIAIDWSEYDLRERDFEQMLADGKVTLLDHPLPNGRVLGTATDEQVALAAKQFEDRGRDLLGLAEWLQTVNAGGALRRAREARHGPRNMI